MLNFRSKSFIRLVDKMLHMKSHLYGSRYDIRAVLYTLIFCTSLSGYAQDPTLPPGKNFDLSEWKITLPDQNEVSETDLAGGYEKANEFYTDTMTGAMVFRCPNDGQTGGSTYPRSELREMLRAGNTSISTKGIGKNNWVFSTSTQANKEASGGVDGTMTATVAVDHVSTTGDNSKIGRVIIGQIHASDDEPCRIYYRKLPNNTLGSIYFAHEPITGSEQWYEMIGSRSSSASNPTDGIALGEKFSYQIKVVGNTLTVTIMRDGKDDVVQEVDMSASGFEDDWMYFKAGNYNQNNSGDPGDYCQVSFFALSKSHSSPNNDAPSTSITTPSNNSSFLVGDDITITADASDTDGTIAKVEFYQGTTKLGEDATAPYSYEWTDVSEGNYVLSSRAIDNANGSSTSAGVSVSVVPVYDAPYDIPKFQGFIGGSKLQAPTSSTVASQSELKDGYSDNNFFVVENDKMAFNQSGTSMRTELRHLENWNATDGNRSMHATIDIVEQTCEQVTVLQIHDDANAGNGPNKPLLRVYKHRTKSPENHLWAAIKVDNEGVNTSHIDLGEDPGGYFDCDIKIVNERLQIEIDGVLKADKDISFWVFPSYWKAGVYLQDEGEATAHFDELQELTEQNTGPVVGITSPESGDSYEAGDNITIRVDASDPDGTISKVEFYAGDSLLGEDLASPYSFIWRTVPGGNYDITAVAVDDDEETTTSASITVEISGSLAEPLSSEFNDENGLRIYPNPFKSELTIEYLGSHEVPTIISVHDVSGRKIDELVPLVQNSIKQAHKWTPPAGLPKGIYFIRLNTGVEIHEVRAVLFDQN
ncbi:MAG: polysaccharide lyase family 7 protein [Cyclobacteriaceae bacterium]